MAAAAFLALIEPQSAIRSANPENFTLE